MNSPHLTARSRPVFSARACRLILQVCGLSLSLALLASCADHRRVIKGDELARMRDQYAADSATDRQHAADQIVSRMRREASAPQPSSDHAAPVYDVLILSGGGDYGAFGAGVLAGWGNVKDNPLERPTFDAVTGISTGALIAPFALVGTDEAYTHVFDLFRNPKPDWAELRDWFFFLPGRTSFLTIKGLKRDVTAAVDTDLVHALAAAADEDRAVAVGTTNIDIGAQRAWLLGREAQAAVHTGDLTRIHKILFASVAVPGAFPPVEIDGGLYVDGGTSSHLLFGTDTSDPAAPFNVWKTQSQGVPYPKVRYWVVINNQLRADPQIIQPQWPSVVGASLSISIRSATVMGLRLLAQSIEVRKLVDHADIEFRYIAIPDDWHAPKEGTFEKETMRSLADLGYRLGSDPASWKEELPPP